MACVICVEDLACVFQLAGDLTGSPQLQEMGSLLGCAAETTYCSVCSCMQTQHKVLFGTALGACSAAPSQRCACPVTGPLLIQPAGVAGPPARHVALLLLRPRPRVPARAAAATGCPRPGALRAAHFRRAARDAVYERLPVCAVAVVPGRDVPVSEEELGGPPGG